MGGPEPVSVRPLHDDDHKSWLSMRQALWMGSDATTRAAEDGTLLSEPERYGARAYAVFVAAQDIRARPIGFVEVSLRDDFVAFAGRTVGYVEGIYVESAHAGSGAGRALIAAATAWTRERGTGTLTAEVQRENQASLAFHESLGFRRRDDAPATARGQIMLALPVA